MIVLRIVAVAIAYIVGIVLATLLRVALPLPFLVAVCALGTILTIYIYARERRWTSWRPSVVALALALVSFPLGYGRTLRALAPPTPGTLAHQLADIPEGAHVKLRGTICAEPQPRGTNYGELTVRVDRILTDEPSGWTPVRPGRVLVATYVSGHSAEPVREAFDRLMHIDAYGYRIEIDAIHHIAPDARNPGEFDTEAYLIQNNIVAKLRCYASHIHILSTAHGHVLTEVALRAKQSFLRTYRQTIRSPASRLVAAATLGARTALLKQQYRDVDITTSFRHAGVGHVLAVSGLHVSIVALLLYFVFRSSGMAPRTFVPILIGFLVLFALLTGARPSSVRAVIMNAVILLSIAYFRFTLRDATAIGLSLSSFLILFVNPMVLYSPGFLLSFGAVLSLVLLAPPLDRWLRLLRGGSLLLALLWFALLIAISFRSMEFFLSGPNWIGLLALLWAGIHYGSRLNDRMPRLWYWGIDRVPGALRMLVAAQLSILAGMLIPMSAWYFGRFPVAGVLVNLVAIPAIGVLVQLGVLVGLLGMIPVIGPLLAAPFGAADTIVGSFFFELARAATQWFPYPAMPRPTIGWLTCYYLALAALVFSERIRTRLRGVLYRWWPRLRAHRYARRIPHVLLLLCLLAPLLELRSARDDCMGLTCLAAGRYPSLAMVSRRGKAIVINGPRAGQGRLLFDVLRGMGAVAVDKLLVCSPNPDAGMAGLSGLPGQMRVRHCFLPAVAETSEEYLDRLGDPYLAAKADEGEPWATAYAASYSNLALALRAGGTALQEIEAGTVVAWPNLSVTVRRGTQQVPKRFVTTAQTPLLDLQFDGFRWLVVTDSSPDILAELLSDDLPPYDVAVIPDLSNRPRYGLFIDMVLRRARPGTLIVSGDNAVPGLDIDQRVAGQSPRCAVILTAREGAVTAEPGEDGTLRIRCFGSGRTISLHAAKDSALPLP